MPYICICELCAHPYRVWGKGILLGTGCAEIFLPLEEAPRQPIFYWNHPPPLPCSRWQRIECVFPHDESPLREAPPVLINSGRGNENGCESTGWMIKFKIGFSVEMYPVVLPFFYLVNITPLMIGSGSIFSVNILMHFLSNIFNENKINLLSQWCLGLSRDDSTWSLVMAPGYLCSRNNNYMMHHRDRMGWMGSLQGRACNQWWNRDAEVILDITGREKWNSCGWKVQWWEQVWHNLTRENPRDLSQVTKVNISSSESCDGVPLIGYDKKVNLSLESGSPNPPPPPQSNHETNPRRGTPSTKRSKSAPNCQGHRIQEKLEMLSDTRGT